MKKIARMKFNNVNSPEWTEEKINFIVLLCEQEAGAFTWKSYKASNYIINFPLASASTEQSAEEWIFFTPNKANQIVYRFHFAPLCYSTLEFRHAVHSRQLCQIECHSRISIVICYAYRIRLNVHDKYELYIVNCVSLSEPSSVELRDFHIGDSKIENRFFFFSSILLNE